MEGRLLPFCQNKCSNLFTLRVRLAKFDPLGVTTNLLYIFFTCFSEMFDELISFEYLYHLHGNLQELGNLARGCTKIADLTGSFRQSPILLKICER